MAGCRPSPRSLSRRGIPVAGLNVWFHPNGAGDVAETPPEATFELVEVEVLVEGRRFVVDGVDHRPPGHELTAASNTAAESVDEEMTAELSALLGSGDRQSGQQHRWDGVRHPPPEARRSLLMGQRAHGQRVVGDFDPLTSGQARVPGSWPAGPSAAQGAKLGRAGAQRTCASVSRTIGSRKPFTRNESSARLRSSAVLLLPPSQGVERADAREALSAAKSSARPFRQRAQYAVVASVVVCLMVRR